MSILSTEIKTIKDTKDYAIFEIEPLEQGFGHTLGTAMRRVLLSSLGGCAITRVKIENVPHEFSTLPGVKEDVVELILNLKKVHFKMSSKKTTIVTLDVKGSRSVTAEDIHCPTGIEIVNPDLYLATLVNNKAVLKIESTVEYSKGYRLPEEGSHKVGLIPIDTNFSPVLRVNYHVEATRVGRITDLDKLILEVWTNGTIGGLEAVQQSAAILVDKLHIIQGRVQLEEVDDGRVVRRETRKFTEQEPYIEELGLPTRVQNTLKKAGIETARDLKNAPREELLKVKNIGPKTLKLIMTRLEKREG